MNICLNNLYLSVCVTQFFRFNSNGSICPREMVSESIWSVCFHNKVVHICKWFFRMIRFCDEKSVLLPTTCTVLWHQSFSMRHKVHDLFDFKYFSFYFFCVLSRNSLQVFFSMTETFFPVHTDNIKLIKMIFENGVCKWESNTYSIQRVFGFLVQRS